MRASLVIPTLNEGSSIGHVLGTFEASAEEANRTLFESDPLDWEMIVVDGASTDDTRERAQQAGARIVVETRPGYGRAYKTGFALASGEIVATSDGDATYPVEAIPGFARRLLDDRIDFLTGNRMAYLDHRSMTTEHRVGNRILNEFVNLSFKRYLDELPRGKLEDSQSGFWVFRRRVLEKVRLTQDGMAFSEELKIEALLRGFKVVEAPIRYGERWGVPKLSSWRDGLKNLLFLVRKRLDVAQEEREVALPVPRHAPRGAPPP